VEGTGFKTLILTHPLITLIGGLYNDAVSGLMWGTYDRESRFDRV
jgi:hypothetical protein